jgi:hypothetical protein
MSASRSAVLAIALATAAQTGCALLSRGPSVDVQWFTPELPGPEASA